MSNTVKFVSLPNLHYLFLNLLYIVDSRVLVTALILPVIKLAL